MQKKIHIPNGEYVSSEVASQFVLGRGSIEEQKKVFRELWLYAPELAMKTADELLSRSGRGNFLLDLAKEIKEGGPITGVRHRPIHSHLSLRNFFELVDTTDTIELIFATGENGLAGLSALANEVRGTLFEDECLSLAGGILAVGHFPNHDHLFRFSIPKGMSREELDLFMGDLAWAIWPGVRYVSHFSRLKPIEGLAPRQDALLLESETLSK